MNVYFWTGDYSGVWNVIGNWYDGAGNVKSDFPNSINDIAIFDENMANMSIYSNLSALGENITIGAFICNANYFNAEFQDNYLLTTKLAYFDGSYSKTFGGKINGNVVYNNIGNWNTQNIAENSIINGNIIIKSEGLIQPDSATLNGNIIINGINTTIKNFTGNAILAGTNCKLINSTGNVLRKGNLNGFEHNGGLPLDVSLNGLG